MTKSTLTVEQVLTLLAETPSRIAMLSAGIAPARLQIRPAENEWSANDVLAHLRSCADVWGGCIDVMIAEERPTIRVINPTTWIKRTDYPDLAFGPSLHAFAAQRTELLAVLNSLPPEGWSRTATVTGAGSVLERTVLSFGQRLVRHERPHIKQIQRLIHSMNIS